MDENKNIDLEENYTAPKLNFGSKIIIWLIIISLVVCTAAGIGFFMV